MIEIPRACITADEIAAYADFFSFGTNDLTQLGFGYSRDDAGKFLAEYVDKGILEKDPFQVLEQKGIGRLMEIGVDLGRQTKPDLKMGICGEHGGEPSSIAFCYSIGLDYVSCSPFRVPVAKLLARWLFARPPAQPLQEAQAHAARHASQRCGPGDACRLDESTPQRPSSKPQQLLKK